LAIWKRGRKKCRLEKSAIRRTKGPGLCLERAKTKNRQGSNSKKKSSEKKKKRRRREIEGERVRRRLEFFQKRTGQRTFITDYRERACRGKRRMTKTPTFALKKQGGKNEKRAGKEVSSLFRNYPTQRRAQFREVAGERKRGWREKV